MSTDDVKGVEFAWWVMKGAQSSLTFPGDSLPRSTIVEDVFTIQYWLPKKPFFKAVSYRGHTYIGDNRYCSFREFLLLTKGDLDTIKDASNGYTGLGSYCMVRRDSILEFISDLKDVGDMPTARKLELVFTKDEDLGSLSILNKIRRERALQSNELRDKLLSYA